MNILLYRNAIDRDNIDKIIKSFQKSKINTDKALFFKVSPRNTYSKLLHKIQQVCPSYSFIGIRGFLLLQGSNLLSENTLNFILNLFEKSLIKKELKKNWFVYELDNLPIFLMFERKNKQILFLPGAPSRPFSGKNNKAYKFLMEWPAYERSFSLLEDSAFIYLINKYLEWLNKEKIEYNTEIVDTKEGFDFTYKSILDIKKINSVYNLYNSTQVSYIPRIYNIDFKKTCNFFLYKTKDNKVKIKSRINKRDFVTFFSFKKGETVKFIYLPNISQINSPDECHNLAKELQQFFSKSVNGTSYYQIAFDEDDSSFNENTTISYGHNTPVEKIVNPRSFIYFYTDSDVIKIGFYKEKLFFISAPTGSLELQKISDYLISKYR